jgi:subfamily B ATP-binding cassette protein MsbA
MKNSEAFKFYLDALKPQRKLLALGLGLTAIESMMLTPIPKLVGLVVDKATDSDFEWVDRNWKWILWGILAFLIVFEPLVYARSVAMGRVSIRVFFTLRVRLWRHLQGLCAHFYAKNRTGDLTSRIVADIQNSSSTVMTVMSRLVWDLMTLIPVLAMMLWTSWQLSLFVVTWAVVQLYFVRRTMGPLQKHSRAIANKLGEISSEATEKLDGHTLVRAFAKEEDVSKRFEGLNRDHMSLSDRMLRYSTLRHVLISAPNIFQNALIALMGAFLARKGVVSAGDIVAVILFAPMVSGPLTNLMNVMTQWSQAMGSIGRINEVFNSFPTVADKPDAHELPRGPGRVTFRDITFTYPTLSEEDAAVATPRKTIDGFSLEIEAGQVVALVGSSGSGKTTMTQLMLRFYDVNDGAVLIDGHDVRDVTLASLRRNIGIVMQDSILFKGTILENLRFANPDATEEKVHEALRFAALGPFIESLPNGIHTALGEGGVNLSGGQRQRLSIARVFLKDPAILILDEATSALDTVAEQQIQSELEKLMAGRTTLVIAHRLSTVRNADRIVVMNAGQIAESGTHDELLAKRGAYYELASLQQTTTPLTMIG